MVYTPLNVYMTGGHMYMYDMMHLMEFTLIFDLGIDNGGEKWLQATNEIHPRMLCKIYCMALAILYLVKEHSKSSFALSTN